jgi:hypothetical protein
MTNPPQLSGQNNDGESWSLKFSYNGSTVDCDIAMFGTFAVKTNKKALFNNSIQLSNSDCLELEKFLIKIKKINEK